MKKTILILFLSLATIGEAQNLKSLFNKYRMNEAFEYVAIEKEMLLMANIFDPNKKDFDETLSKIRGIKILTHTDGFDDTTRKKVEKDLDLVLENENLEKILELRENLEQVEIYTQSKKENLDMLISTADEETLTLIWIRGKLSAKELLKLLNK